ncbi:MAG: hypothetical protein AAGF46_01600 [Pseudomonadota bacterium]
MTNAPIESFLPHRKPMLLLDRLIDGDPSFARSAIAVSEQDLFFEEGMGLPAWALLEYFAQTAALIGGLEAEAGAKAVPQGFLLGTRKLECEVSHIPAGVELELEAKLEFADGAGMSAYHCRTLNPEYPVTCVLSVYVPPADDGAPSSD